MSRVWKVLLAAGALGLTAAGALATAIFRQRWIARWLSERSPEVLYFVSTRDKVVALTIDDSPDERSTPLILEALERHSARATFFVIGSHGESRERLLATIVAKGHELGNHTWGDQPSIRLSREEFEHQVVRTHSLIARFGAPKWLRPGSGRYDGEMIEVARRHGYTIALGSVYPFDPHIPVASFLRRHVLTTVHPGAIIVLHDGGKRGTRTAQVLDAVLPELARRGYTVTTLSGLAVRGARVPD